jgi:hypothetical protein
MKNVAITIYLGSGKMGERRLDALDGLARAHVPEDLLSRPGSERSVLFQLLADNPEAANQALALFMQTIRK